MKTINIEAGKDKVVEDLTSMVFDGVAQEDIRLIVNEPLNEKQIAIVEELKAEGFIQETDKEDEYIIADEYYVRIVQARDVIKRD